MINGFQTGHKYRMHNMYDPVKRKSDCYWKCVSTTPTQIGFEGSTPGTVYVDRRSVIHEAGNAYTVKLCYKPKRKAQQNG